VSNNQQANQQQHSPPADRGYRYRRPKALIVLGAMWEGIPLEHGGEQWHLLDREDGKGKAMAIQRTCITYHKGVEVSRSVKYLGIDWPIQDVLAMLEEVSDDTVASMVASLVITEHAGRKPRGNVREHRAGLGPRTPGGL